MRKPLIGISLDPNVLQKFDTGRGDVPRSRAIERLLEEKFGNIPQTTEKA